MNSADNDLKTCVRMVWDKRRCHLYTYDAATSLCSAQVNLIIHAVMRYLSVTYTTKSSCLSTPFLNKLVASTLLAKVIKS